MWTKFQQLYLQLVGHHFNQGVNADQLHTDLLPGPAVTTTPYQDADQRIRVVGWRDKDGVTHPAWIAVTRFAGDWPPEFYWLDTMASNGASIGALFRFWNFPPLQNRLLCLVVPAAAIPQWVHAELKQPDRWWTIEVYNFCAEVNGGLYEYGLLCEFRPRRHRLPPRSCLGLLEVWRRLNRHDHVATYLKRTDRPTQWDYLVMWLARAAALPVALKAINDARNAF